MAYNKERFLQDWVELSSAKKSALVYRSHDYQYFSVGPALTEEGYPAFFVIAACPCQEQMYQHMTLRIRQQKAGGYFLVLALQDAELINGFADLCAILDEEAERTEQKRGEIFLKDQLDRWSALLQRSRGAFSLEKILGLWGELFVLKKLISAIGARKAVEAWKAPKEKTEYDKFNAVSQDFSFDECAIEVKTRKEQVDVVTISSLEQLDPIPGQHLFLYVVTLMDATKGKNLSDMIEDVRRTLSKYRAEIEVKDQFENLIKLCDFDEISAIETKNYRFEATAENIYDATSEMFPSLRRTKLPLAVTRCHYRLSLSALSSFETELFE